MRYTQEERAIWILRRLVTEQNTVGAPATLENLNAAAGRTGPVHVLVALVRPEIIRDARELLHEIGAIE